MTQSHDRTFIARIDAFQQRHPSVGTPLAVVYKYVDDGGPHLAALITYYAFISLFPLLLLASTILSFVLDGRPDLQRDVLDSALSQLPIIGNDLRRPDGIGGGTAGIVIGLTGALYGAMGVGQALQNAANTAWTVARNVRPNPFALRARSLVLLVVIGVDVLGTSALTGLVGLATDLPRVSGAALLVGSLALHGAAFGFVFRFAPARRLSWRQVLPGAAVASTAWLALQYVGLAYVGGVVAESSDTNSVFAVVLGLLGFLYVTSVMIVLALELNVVLVDRLHPRTLLTPFTDNVVLTPADKRSYTGLAQAQRQKGFQRIRVLFDPSPAEKDVDPD